MITAELTPQVTDLDNSVTPPLLHSPTRLPVAWEDYIDSCQRYEKKADLILRNFDTAILAGHGLKMCVRYGSLSCEYLRVDGNRKVLRLDKAVSKIRQIVVFNRGGFLTLDAITWCQQQNITIIMLDYNGQLLNCITPRQARNARLNFRQFLAMQPECMNSPALAIARELIQRKTLAQIAVLNKRHSNEQVIAMLENGLHELQDVTSIEALRLLEARLAVYYWRCFADIPLKWHGMVRNIPEHWRKIGMRSSPIDGSNRHAVSPFHACLNFALALLQADVLQAVNVSGLEPTIGFLHSYDGLKSSLVYDLMEPFRPMIDRLVLNFFRETTLKKGDFIQAFSGEARLSDGLRKYILSSCRVDHIQIDRLCRLLREKLEAWETPKIMLTV